MELPFVTSEVLERAAINYAYDEYARSLSWPVAKQAGELVVYVRRYSAWRKSKRFLSSLFPQI